MAGGSSTIQWVPGKESYCTAVANTLLFYGTESDSPYLTLTSEKQILSTAWISVLSLSLPLSFSSLPLRAPNYVARHRS